MKTKLLLTIIAATALTLCVSAQNAEQILARYEQATGLNKVDLKSRDLSMMLDLNIEAQGMAMPMKYTVKGTDKFRAEMEAMGQKILIVRNGDKGWMSMGGQVQPMSIQQLQQQSSQANVLESMKIDRAKYTVAYVKEEKEGATTYDVITITAIDKNDPVGTQTLFFDRANGLLTKAKGSVGGADFSMTLESYKDFAGVKLPSVLSTLVGGKVAAKVTINSMELDYPTAEWMFAEPK